MLQLHTTCYILHVTATHYMLQLHTTCYSYILHATYYMLQLHTTCCSYILHVTATYYMLHVTVTCYIATTYYMLHTTCYILHTTCYSYILQLHTTCYSYGTAHFQLDARVHQLTSEWLIFSFTSIKTCMFNPFTRELALACLCARVNS